MDAASATTDKTTDATCSLAPEQLGDRVMAWRALATRATDRQMRPGRITSTYPTDPETVHRLTQLIEAERRCCAFLRFTVHHEGDLIRVELEYPPGFEGLLTRMLDGS